MNFKQETLEELKEHNLTWNDVEFIQTNDFCIKGKDKFLEQMDFDYDDGYGSEWWEFKRLPIKKAKVCNAKFKNVYLGMELVEEGKEETQPVKKNWCDGCSFLCYDSLGNEYCSIIVKMKNYDEARFICEEDKEKNCPVKELKNAKN